MDDAIVPSQIYQLIYTDATFIDLRDDYSFDQLHIKNFINMSSDQLLSSMHQFPLDKPIYLICYTGKQSQKVCQKLRSLGYDSYYIQGGFDAFLSIPPAKYY